MGDPILYQHLFLSKENRNFFLRLTTLGNTVSSRECFTIEMREHNQFLNSLCLNYDAVTIPFVLIPLSNGNDSEYG